MSFEVATNQEQEKEELVDEYKFISVEVGNDGSVILPKGAIPLNAMYSPGTMKLGIIALVPEEYPEEAEPEAEPVDESITDENAVTEDTTVKDAGAA